MKKVEIRERIIKSKLKNIEESIIFIEDNLPDRYSSFNTKMIKNAIYKEVEYAIESIIDICSVINSDLSLGSPETEDSIFDHLLNKKILNERVMKIIIEMKKFRNLLVHRYGEIDDKKAYETIKDGLRDIELIIKEIETFLKKQ